MANGGSIKYNIGFNVDKSGLNQLKSSLQEIKMMTAQDFMKITGGNDLSKAQKELKEIHQTLGKVDAAFESAFNSDLGTLNIAKFNQTLNNSGLTIQKIHADLARTGTAGQNAFRNMTSQILTTNMKLKESHTLIDSMATTMANTIKWGAASSVMNSFTGTVRRAYGYVKSLDGSLNDIRIVTGKSADEMDRFAEKANKAAKNLGQTTTNYTDAALIYYQQGLSDAEVQARAEVTLKAANVTGQSGAEVSEQLTAVWNGYKVSAEEAELYIDKLAAVAAKTAANLEELSTGMSKVASAANLMGVDVDQLNAQLATIVSVTRQAPESVGTALKTIYARMGDIEAGLDSETTLGDYTEKMAEMGVNVLDMNGKLRDMGEVMEEIGGKWTSMSREQQIYLSQVMAGTRQYNNLLALFDNWGQYTKALETSSNAAGTLQEQQDIYMESTQAHLAQLRASWEDLYDSLLDADSINGVSDALSGIVSLMANFVDSIGGGSGVLLTLGSIGMQVFGKHIASGLATTIVNMRAAKENTAQLIAEMEILNQFENANIDDARTQRLIEMKRQQLDLTKMMTAEERNVSNEYINQQNELYKEQDIIEENLKLIEESYKRASGKDIKLTHNTDALTGKVTIDNQQEVKDTLQTKAGDLLSEAKGLEDSQETVDAFQRMTEAAREYHREMELGRGQIKASEEKAITVWTETNDTIIESVQLARDLAQSDKVSAENKEELNEALKEWNRLTKDGTEVDLTNIRVVEQAEKVRNAHIKTLKTQGKEYQNQVATLDNSSEKIENNNAQVKNLSQTWKNFIDRIDLKNNIMQFTTLIGKVGQIAAGINSLNRIPSIFNNEDLSTGEKFLQIISSLSMGLPMLINGIMGSVTAYKTLTASLKGALLMSELKQMSDLKGIGLENARNILEAKQIILQKAGIVLNKKELQSLTPLELEKLLQQKLDAKEITLDTKHLIQQKFGILQNKEETTSLGALIAARTKNIALKMIENPLYLAAAAAAAIAVVGIWNMVKAENAEAEAAQEASKNAQELQTKYTELNSAAKEFKETISNYEDGVQAFKELDRGADEYQSKLEELNEEAKKLIETYDLYDAYHYEDGLIKIDLDKLKEAQKEMEAIANAAERQALGAKIYEKNVHLTADAKEVSYQIGTYFTSEEIINVANAVRGFREEIKETKGVNEAVNLSSEQLKAKLEENAEKYNLSNGTLESINNLLDQNSTDAIYEFIESLEEAEAANRSYAEEILKSIASEKYSKIVSELAGDDDVLAMQLNQAAEGLAAQAKTEKGLIADERADLETSIRASIAEAVGEWDDASDTEALIKKFAKDQEIDVSEASKKAFGIGYGGNISTQTMAKRYFESQGYTGVTVTDKSGGKNVVEYVDKDGKIQSENLTNEMIQKLWAQQMSQAILDLKTEELLSDVLSNDQMESILSTLKELPSAMGGSAEQWRQAFTDGIANKGDFNFNSLFGEIDEDEYNKLMDMSGKDLMNLFGFSEDDIKAMGIDTADKFKEAFQEGMKDYDSEAFALAADQAGSAKAEELDLDLDEFEAYRDLLAQENKELAKNRDALNEVAIANKRMERGVKDIASNWEDFNEIMSDSDASLEDVSSIMPEINNALQDILNLDTEDFELLPPDFAQKHWDLINDVTNGVEGAVDELRDAAGQEILLNVDGILNDEQLQADMLTLHNEIAAYDAVSDFEVGVVINDAEFIEKCNEIIQRAGMTAEEANAYFKSMGYDVELQEVQAKDTPMQTYTWYPLDEEATEKAGGIPQFSDTPKTVSTSSTTEGTAYAVKTITPTGSYGGGVGVKTTAPKSSTAPRTSKKSGGGGGGSKSKEPDKMDPLKDERDRYHDINNELKKLNTQFERQDRITSKLTGKDRIAALNKQIELLDQQNARQQEKLNLLRQEQAELQNALKAQGVNFDAEGDITNFNAALQAKENYINGLINRYNSMSAEEQGAFKETIEKAKEDYEQFKENMDRYEEVLLDEIPEMEDSINEALDQKIEFQIEAMEIEVELKLDLQEAKRQLNDFIRDFVDKIKDDDILGIQESAMNSIPTYLGNDGAIQTNLSAFQDALDAYETIKNGGTDDVFGDDAAAALESVLKYRDETINAIEEADQLLEEVQQNYLDGIEAANEAFDEHLDKYQQINDQLEHNLTLVELLAGEEAYEAQLKYYNQMEQNNLARLDFAKKEVDFWKERMAAEEEDSEAWKIAQQNAIEAQENLNGLIEESIELAQTKFEATVKSIIKEMNDNFTGGLGLEYVAEEWELINKEADMYLDTINSVYEVQKLENKFSKAIDETSSLKAQQRLNDLMDEELDKLREKDKLTQYEVDRANALFDLELKKIALEEAQRNKSTMRLRRDSQGNYSYQYVSDQDAIADAQAEVEEAQNSLYNLDKEAYQENLDQLLSIYTEWQEKVEEINIKYKDDEAERQRQLALINEHYGNMITGLTKQNTEIRNNLMSSTFAELSRLRGIDLEEFQNLSDEEKRIIMESMVPQWNNGVQIMADKFIGNGTGSGFIDGCEVAFGKLNDATANYQQSLDNLANAAGVDLEMISTGQQTLLSEIEQLTTDNDILIGQYEETLSKLEDNVRATEDWVKACQDLAREAANAMAKVIALQQTESARAASFGSKNSNSGGNGGFNKDSSNSSTKDKNNGNSGSNPDGNENPKNNPNKDSKIDRRPPYYYRTSSDSKSVSIYFRDKISLAAKMGANDLLRHPVYKNATRFKTGGYTGEWTNGDRDGRLALLHQKELILNAEDTKNILNTVDMVRSLNDSMNSRMFNLFNASAIDKLYNLLAEREEAPIEQNIEIHASFPGVTVEREIEEAFDNLLTRMTQQVFKTKR